MTIEIPNGWNGPTVVATHDGAVSVLVSDGHTADGRRNVVLYLDREQCAQLLAALHRAAEATWPGPNEVPIVPRYAEMGGPL